MSLLVVGDYQATKLFTLTGQVKESGNDLKHVFESTKQFGNNVEMVDGQVIYILFIFIYYRLSGLISCLLKISFDNLEDLFY